MTAKAYIWSQGHTRSKCLERPIDSAPAAPVLWSFSSATHHPSRNNSPSSLCFPWPGYTSGLAPIMCYYNHLFTFMYVFIRDASSLKEKTVSFIFVSLLPSKMPETNTMQALSKCMIDERMDEWVNFMCSPPIISKSNILRMMGLHNSIHPPWSPGTKWASNYASSIGSLLRTFSGKRWKGAEPGSFSPLWPLELFSFLSNLLKVGTKSLLASQALGAVLGISYNRKRTSLVCRYGLWQPVQQLQAFSHHFSRR